MEGGRISRRRRKAQEFVCYKPRCLCPESGRQIECPGNRRSGFWLGLHTKGLTELSPKILERTEKDSGSVILVLRVEMTFNRDNKPRTLVSAEQTWVKRRGTWHILVTQRSDAVTLYPIRLPQPDVPNTSLYSDPKDAHKELGVALAAARMDHKRVVVVFGAN
jgi:hypothetical protein